MLINRGLRCKTGDAAAAAKSESGVSLIWGPPAPGPLGLAAAAPLALAATTDIGQKE